MARLNACCVNASNLAPEPANSRYPQAVMRKCKVCGTIQADGVALKFWTPKLAGATTAKAGTEKQSFQPEQPLPQSPSTPPDPNKSVGSGPVGSAPVQEKAPGAKSAPTVKPSDLAPASERKQ